MDEKILQLEQLILGSKHDCKVNYQESEFHHNNYEAHLIATAKEFNSKI